MSGQSKCEKIKKCSSHPFCSYDQRCSVARQAHARSAWLRARGRPAPRTAQQLSPRRTAKPSGPPARRVRAFGRLDQDPAARGHLRGHQQRLESCAAVKGIREATRILSSRILSSRWGKMRLTSFHPSGAPWLCTHCLRAPPVASCPLSWMQIYATKYLNVKNLKPEPQDPGRR